MKTVILIERVNKNIELPKLVKKGEWIDLRCSETTKFRAPQSGVLKSRTVDGVEEKYRNVSFDMKLLPLGIKVRMPDGFEGNIVPRSSTCTGMGLIQGNHYAVIDSPYCGPNDEWKFSAVAMRDTTVMEGERICQFRINLSQKATMWQKIKWLLSSGVKIVEVDKLPPADDRKGFGEGTKGL